MASIINISSTTKQWMQDGILYWVTPIGTNQACAAGYVYTPVNSPITLANVFDGGTYAQPAPVYPPIEESRANALVATNTLSDAKIAQIIGGLTNTVGDTRSYVLLKSLVDNNTATPEQAAQFAALDAKYDQTQAITDTRDALVVWINAQTSAQVLAEFDAASPPAGYEWP